MKLIDLPDLQIFHEELLKELKQELSEFSDTILVKEDSYLKFPNIGNEKTLYMDTTKSMLYRWSDSDLKYYQLGADYNDIEVINGSIL